MIHVYHGNGKGKTTAAIGLMIRQLGAGKAVVFAQFLKDGTSSEIAVLKQLQISYMHTLMPKSFYKDMNAQESEEVERSCQLVLQDAFRQTSDCIVLDEILDVLSLGLLQEEDVISLLKKNKHKEIILTGRKPSKDLLELSDYCSECVAIKHPYQKGIKARKGVEF